MSRATDRTKGGNPDGRLYQLYGCCIEVLAIAKSRDKTHLTQGGRIARRSVSTLAFSRPGAVLHRDRLPAFEGEDQVLGMEFQLLQPNLFELFVIGKIRFSNQFFQPLSVATVFGVQAIYFFAQRIVYFVHLALLFFPNIYK